MKIRILERNGKIGLGILETLERNCNWRGLVIFSRKEMKGEKWNIFYWGGIHLEEIEKLRANERKK